MLITNFNNIVDEWINAVRQYSAEQLYIKPAPGNWSIGQVCVHLVNDTNWFIQQIKICASVNGHTKKTMHETAKIMFVNNSFPDEKLTNPANENMPQPESKEHLLNLLNQLKVDMNNAALNINEASLQGKTQHPGLGYFNATEWLQFATMHLQHHFKQKKRIEEFFNHNKN